MLLEGNVNKKVDISYFIVNRRPLQATPPIDSTKPFDCSAVSRYSRLELIADVYMAVYLYTYIEDIDGIRLLIMTNRMASLGNWGQRIGRISTKRKEIAHELIIEKRQCHVVHHST